MKTIKEDQVGFAGVHAILVIVVIVLVAAVGWFVMSAKTNNKHAAQRDTTRAKTAETCTSSNTSRYCIEHAPAQEMKLSELPPELQNVVKATYTQQASDCLKNDQIIDYNGNAIDLKVAYAPIGSAIVGIGCNDSSAGLFAKDLKTGDWKFVQKTQMAFGCDAVFNNPVPKSLLSLNNDNAKCYEGSELQKYDDASAERFQ